MENDLIDYAFLRNTIQNFAGSIVDTEKREATAAAFDKMNKIGWEYQLVDIIKNVAQLKKAARANSGNSGFDKETYAALKEVAASVFIAIAWMRQHADEKNTEKSIMRELPQRKYSLYEYVNLKTKYNPHKLSDTLGSVMSKQIEDDIDIAAMCDERRRVVTLSSLNDAWNRLLSYDVIKDNVDLYPIMMRVRPMLKSKSFKVYKLRMVFDSSSDMNVFLRYKDAIENHLKILLGNACLKITTLTKEQLCLRQSQK